ncbi:hypothetical protein NITHO_1570004 [Nitrolancea hollandica Lb]|uniref:Uncharacterized protein n=1 Tax=Nitrolancea hollandica Lb TaxID=1129897 RepID=I4EDM6_9BACT|nr:hypothetical protein NITHO_1570004 [Nitrolancea hollandica Lb]
MPGQMDGMVCGTYRARRIDTLLEAFLQCRGLQAVLSVCEEENPSWKTGTSFISIKMRLPVG